MNKYKAVVVRHFMSTFKGEAHEFYDAVQENPEILKENLVWTPFDHLVCKDIADHMDTLYNEIIGA